MSETSELISAAREEFLVKNGNKEKENAEFPQADLLKWKDMPRHLQFNQYIFEGYRPLTNVKGCIHSLFYFHNETINILTHGEYFFFYVKIYENNYFKHFKISKC